jgi:hypothetical protein
MLFLGGCSDLSEPCIPTKTSGPILPLAVGNQWIYQVTIYKDEYGGIGSISRDTISISFDTLVKGEKWYFLGPNSLVGFVGFCTNRPNGLWGMEPVSADSQITALIYPNPTFTGDSTSSQHPTVTLSVDSSISVPYGCFFSNHYIVAPYDQSPYDWFMTQGVGLVRRESWYNGLSHWYKLKQWELISLTLK